MLACGVFLVVASSPKVFMVKERYTPGTGTSIEAKSLLL
jgi:hypothetical protein